MCSESTAESEPSYLTVAQLAQRLQVSESTIYGWVDRDLHSVSYGRRSRQIRSKSDSQMDVGGS